MAMVHRLRNDPEALLRAIERVIAMDPDHEEALEWAAWSYMALGHPERGVGILERLVERHSDAYSSAMWLTACYEMLGRSEDAARAARLVHERVLSVLRKHPEDVYARSQLANVLVQIGEREAGIAEAERVVVLAPNEGRIRYNAACAFAQAGLPERAIEQLQEGTRNIPSYLADWPRRDPDLASLHDHPEFIRLFGKAE